MAKATLVGENRYRDKVDQCGLFRHLIIEIYTEFSMWIIYEHRRVEKSLSSAPLEVHKRYEKWKEIVAISGPQGVRHMKGFRDEALSGEWAGYRSSRLNIQYRVVYLIEKDKVLVWVESVTPHDCRKK